MATKLYCDRCGKEIHLYAMTRPEHPEHATLCLRFSRAPEMNEDYDLCAACADDVIGFIEGTK